MRYIIPVVSFVLLLSSCDGAAPAPPSISATPSTSTSAPAAASNSQAETARTTGQSVAPASGAPGSGDPAEGEALFKQPIVD